MSNRTHNEALTVPLTDLIKALETNSIQKLIDQTLSNASVLNARYVSEWEEGVTSSNCVLDADTFELLDIERVDGAFEHLESEYVELCHDGKTIQLDADNGELTSKGRDSLKSFLAALRTPTNATPSPARPKLQFAIQLDGGLVQNIFTKNNAGFDLEFSVYDYDTSDLEKEDLTTITQPNGQKANAYVTHQGINENPEIDLYEIFNA